MRLISDETIKELLQEASLRDDSLMIAICRAALFGSLDARNQLSTIFKIQERAAQLGGRIEDALAELTPVELEWLQNAAINHFETK